MTKLGKNPRFTTIANARRVVQFHDDEHISWGEVSRRLGIDRSWVFALKKFYKKYLKNHEK